MNLSSPEFLLGLGVGAGPFAFLGLFGCLWLRQGRDLFAARLRADLTAEHANLLRAEAAARAAAETRAARLPEIEGALFDLRFENSDLRARAAELDALLTAEKDARADQLRLLDDARAELSDAFRALSADALRANQTSFLALAETHLGRFHEAAAGDLERRQQAIDALVGPVRESLDKWASTWSNSNAPAPEPTRGFPRRCVRSWKSSTSCAGKRTTSSTPCAGPTCADAGGKSSSAASSNSPGCSTTATSSSNKRARPTTTARGCGPTCSCACPPTRSSSWMPRPRWTRISTPPATA